MLSKNALATLAAGLMVVGATTSAFAQKADHRDNAARDAAIHECSVKASKWSNTMWQTQQFAVYSNCMIEHGQQP